MGRTTGVAGARRHGTGRRAVVGISCLVIVLTACGRSGSAAKDAGGTTSSTSGAAAETATADFGDLSGVCSPGKATSSPTTGVSADEIRIATFSDTGFAGRPGLNQEFFDTAEVFSKWCNANGGINGRRIVVDERDAALTNVQARMIESCADDFAMVGGGATFDADGVEPRLKCLLPDIAGFVASLKARGADLLVQPEPNALTSLQVGNLRYLGQKFPDATDHLGVLAGDLPLTKEVGQQNADAAKAFGWKIVYDDVYPAAGVTDWTPYAQKLKDAGVKGLIWVGEPEGLGAIVSALRDIGYPLDFVRADANHYDQKLIDAAGAGLATAPVYVQLSVVPFEEASPSSATAQYLKLFDRFKPGGKSHTYLGLNAFSAWLLFAQAAKSCGDDLTRRCLYDGAKKVHSWTGGGLHAETDPGTGASTPCFAAMRATPKGFVLATDTRPDDGIFNCSPKNLFSVPANADQRTTLADVGQSLADLK